MKKITLLTMALLCMFQSYAQNASEKDQYLSSPFCKNWTASIGAGVELHPHAELLMNKDLEVPMFSQFDLSVGKWLSPYVGFRAKFAYSPFEVTSTSANNVFLQGNETSADGHLTNLHGDIMLDLTSLIAGYNDERFYSLIPYAGFGYAKVKASDVSAREYTSYFGLLNEFRLCRALSLHIDLGLSAPNAGLYGERSKNPRFYTTSITGGLTYFFGRSNARKFDSVATSAGFLALAAQNASLNGDNDKLNRANSSLARDKAALQKEVEDLRVALAEAEKNAAVEPEIEIAPVAIFFGFDKSDVTKQDVARLKYVAELLKAQPEAKFSIEGYADSKYGTEKYNKALSQRRAEAVCDVLVNTYGVDADQVEAVGNGAVNDLFEDITLNRAVITRSK